MKVEAWIFGIVTLFMLVVAPVYWFMSEDPTGTTFDYGIDPDTGQSNIGDAGTAHTIQSRLLLTF